jgi:hypothetical protein
MDSSFQPFKYGAQRFYPPYITESHQPTDDCVILEKNLFHPVQTEAVFGQYQTTIVEGSPGRLPERDTVIITIATAYENLLSKSGQGAFAVYFGPESRFNIQRPVLGVHVAGLDSHLHAATDALIAAGILREVYPVDGQNLRRVILITDESVLVDTAVNDLSSWRSRRVLNEKTENPDLWERLGAEIDRLNSKGVEIYFWLEREDHFRKIPIANAAEGYARNALNGKHILY